MQKACYVRYPTFFINLTHKIKNALNNKNYKSNHPANQKNIFPKKAPKALKKSFICSIIL